MMKLGFWEIFGIIILALLAWTALYHNGVLNFAFPGFKTVSRKKALQKSVEIANVAYIGGENHASGGSFTSPVPLPVMDTWGGSLAA